MAMVNIRYIVNDMDKAIHFYTELLDFDVVRKAEPDSAILIRGDLRLLLSSPNDKEAGEKATAVSPQAQTGSWNRFILEVNDLETSVNNLKKEGVTIRNDIISGEEGNLAIINDSSGNPIELFEYFKDNPRLQ